MTVKIAWTRNISDDIWRGGPCDTVKECVEEARAEGYKDTDRIALGYVEPYQVNSVNSDQIIEFLQQNAVDEIGEVADDWLSNITKEQYKDLGNRVLKVVKEWLKNCNEEPTFYKVLPIAQMTLQEALQKYDKSHT